MRGEGAGAGVPMAEDAGHGRARGVGGLGRAKGVASSHVSRILRLTLLAPEIVEAILDGRQPAELQLDDLLAGFWLNERVMGRSPCDRRHQSKIAPGCIRDVCDTEPLNPSRSFFSGC
jgi:hypothetical protein